MTAPAAASRPQRLLAGGVGVARVAPPRGARHADPSAGQARGADGGGRGEVGSTGEHAEQGSGAGHRGGQGTRGVLRGRDRHDARGRHQPHGRLEAHAAVVGRGAGDRPVGLGADGEVDQPGADGRAASRARPARRAVQCVRVAREPAVGAPSRGRLGVAEVGPLTQVGLAEDDHPGLAQAGHQGRVGRGRLGTGQVGQGQRPGGGRETRGVDVVLHEHRHSVQRPARATLEGLGVAGLGLGGRGGVEGAHGAHERVGPGDAGQGLLDQVA